ncbi:hypothetical protein DPMN_103313 [Dreissena polymorpha]|uniref:Uncharacterized protein n=1 Tax=Dreissena polymorpha TaxID=45954 RepID=A0A9D4K026_DREPO|nr:hypothetical protein DPMN_103313 [Dreissena polymorpha]
MRLSHVIADVSAPSNLHAELSFHALMLVPVKSLRGGWNPSSYWFRVIQAAHLYGPGSIPVHGSM